MKPCFAWALQATVLALSTAAYGDEKAAPHILPQPQTAPNFPASPSPNGPETAVSERPAIRALVRYKENGVVREMSVVLSPDQVKVGPQNASISQTGNIPRYTESYIYGLMLYYPAPKCQEITPGEWALVVTPFYGSATFRKETGPSDDCPGVPFTYNRVYYTWTSHTNKSLGVNKSGPTDSFLAQWTAPGYTLNYTFPVSVDAVRPTGETTKFEGWGGPAGGAVGQWNQTLIPPANDPGFDFSGEWVRERFTYGASGCPEPPAQFAPDVNKKNYGSSWPVTSGNVWGPDGVGFGNEKDASCTIEYSRCKVATCSNSRIQQMSIKSPADTDFVDYGPTNHLIWANTGRIIRDPIHGNRIGFGSIYSVRISGNESQSEPHWNPVVTFNACPREAVPASCR